MTAPVTSAMVFAAGLGTRMRPLTDTTPKPLVQIGGRTLLDHMLDRLADGGVTRAVVNVHHLPEQIEQSLAGRTRPAIVISNERERLLDQGGGIVKALPALGDAPFFICNTDALWTEPAAPGAVERLRRDWDPARMDVLLLVANRVGSVGVDWPGDFHRVPDGRLVRRREGETSDFVYAGVGILKPELFADVTDPVFRLAPFFFVAAEQGRLFGTRLDGTWLHVGTVTAIGAAEAVWSNACERTRAGG